MQEGAQAFPKCIRGLWPTVESMVNLGNNIPARDRAKRATAPSRDGAI
jgi:hypothetical protein